MLYVRRTAASHVGPGLASSLLNNSKFLWQVPFLHYLRLWPRWPVHVVRCSCLYLIIRIIERSTRVVRSPVTPLQSKHLSLMSRRVSDRRRLARALATASAICNSDAGRERNLVRQTAASVATWPDKRVVVPTVQGWGHNGDKRHRRDRVPLSYELTKTKAGKI